MDSVTNYNERIALKLMKALHKRQPDFWWNAGIEHSYYNPGKPDGDKEQKPVSEGPWYKDKDKDDEPIDTGKPVDTGKPGAPQGGDKPGDDAGTVAHAWDTWTGPPDGVIYNKENKDYAELGHFVGKDPDTGVIRIEYADGTQEDVTWGNIGIPPNQVDMDPYSGKEVQLMDWTDPDIRPREIPWIRGNIGNEVWLNMETGEPMYSGPDNTLLFANEIEAGTLQPLKPGYHDDGTYDIDDFILPEINGKPIKTNKQYFTRNKSISGRRWDGDEYQWSEENKRYEIRGVDVAEFHKAPKQKYKDPTDVEDSTTKHGYMKVVDSQWNEETREWDVVLADGTTRPETSVSNYNFTSDEIDEFKQHFIESVNADIIAGTTGSGYDRWGHVEEFLGTQVEAKPGTYVNMWGDGWLNSLSKMADQGDNFDLTFGGKIGKDMVIGSSPVVVTGIESIGLNFVSSVITYEDIHGETHSTKVGDFMKIADNVENINHLGDFFVGTKVDTRDWGHSAGEAVVTGIDRVNKTVTVEIGGEYPFSKTYTLNDILSRQGLRIVAPDGSSVKGKIDDSEYSWQDFAENYTEEQVNEMISIYMEPGGLANGDIVRAFDIAVSLHPNDYAAIVGASQKRPEPELIEYGVVPFQTDSGQQFIRLPNGSELSLNFTPGSIVDNRADAMLTADWEPDDPDIPVFDMNVEGEESGQARDVGEGLYTTGIQDLVDAYQSGERDFSSFLSSDIQEIRDWVKYNQENPEARYADQGEIHQIFQHDEDGWNDSFSNAIAIVDSWDASEAAADEDARGI